VCTHTHTNTHTHTQNTHTHTHTHRTHWRLGRVGCLPGASPSRGHCRFYFRLSRGNGCSTATALALRTPSTDSRSTKSRRIGTSTQRVCARRSSSSLARASRFISVPIQEHAFGHVPKSTIVYMHLRSSQSQKDSDAYHCV
jgi:hypothetical protein